MTGSLHKWIFNYQNLNKGIQVGLTSVQSQPPSLHPSQVTVVPSLTLTMQHCLSICKEWSYVESEAWSASTELLLGKYATSTFYINTWTLFCFASARLRALWLHILNDKTWYDFTFNVQSLDPFHLIKNIQPTFRQNLDLEHFFQWPASPPCLLATFSLFRHPSVPHLTPSEATTPSSKHI